MENPFENFTPHLFPRLEKAAQFIRSIVCNTNVQMCESDHYVREHFTDAPVQQPQGLPPAQQFEEPGL